MTVKELINELEKLNPESEFEWSKTCSEYNEYGEGAPYPKIVGETYGNPYYELVI
ncbi:hypothetical protein SAMN04487821_11047 [Enterococcus malodoratus]|uniref:hypothetical protein n=1 Tax=Enterococcus malodoratus TaxID=71451 RepID=UPI0008B7D224|nr:hypothetical protein [Enterococcus malodoratus]SET33954.1 hypothetical protein SAMN04487821_11047 [Enterococcus malodoratus]